MKMRMEEKGRIRIDSPGIGVDEDGATSEYRRGGALGRPIDSTSVDREVDVD